MVSVLVLNAEGHRFDPQPGQTKDIICFFPAKHAKSGQPRVRIICLGKVTCLLVDCSFHEVER